MTDAQVLEDDINTLLAELRQAGVRLYLDGDALRVRGARDALTPALTRRVQAAKPALLVRLQAASVAAAAPARIPLRTPEEPIGLSFLQQNLWLIDQLEGSVHYNMAVALDARGNLDADALEQALRRIVERHESLRTVFRVGPGAKPVQVVCTEVAFGMERIDLRRMPPDACEAEMEKIVAAESKTPFDLVHDLMLRARLVQLDDDRHVLLITKHHIASDGWSMDVLLDEMCQLYEAFRQGLPDPLPPLPIQYADYSAWLARWLHGDVLRDKLDYWASHLAGLPELHALPLDRPRPPRRTINGGRHARVLALSRPEALSEVCSRYDVTLFTLLEAVFALLVARWGGVSDVAVATPISARSRPELVGLIGYFTNTLILRSDCRGDQRFDDFLRSSRQMMLEAHDHHHVPFEMLVDRINPARSLAHNALVQLSFTLQNNRAATMGTIDLPGLRIAPLRNDEHASVKFDLELTVKEGSDGLLAKWNYNTDIFDVSTIERMDQAFGVLLEAILEDPTRALASYPIMPPGDADAMAAWNATGLETDDSATLHGLFRQCAKAMPETIALVEAGVRCTYAELDRRSDRLAGHLAQTLGAAPGRVVGVGVPRSIDMVVALLGVLKTGAAYLPLDPLLPGERLSWMIVDSGAIAIIGREDVAAAFAACAPTLPLVRESAVVESSVLPVGGDANDIAYVIYTSGSTGRPKGTLNPHRGVCNRIQGMRAQFDLTESDRVLQKTPLGFDVSVSEIFWPLASGATLVLATPDGHRDPAYLYTLLVEQGVTVAHFVPSMLQAFLRVNPAPALPRLRYLFTSGEALPCDLQEQCVRLLPDARKYNHYGPTETAIEVTGWCFDRCRDDRVVPIGRPVANVRAYILDERDGEQPIGVAGELCIAGVQVGDGYLNQPALTAERFVTIAVAGRMERVYRTGDRARWLKDGQIQFLGRLDGQVKLRGFRIETGEIESTLVQHGGVSRAGVVLWEGEGPGSARLVAYVVAGSHGVENEPLLREALMRHLPEYMIPSQYVWLDALPLTTSGKLDRKALPPPTPRQALDTDRAPSTATESSLLELYAELLGQRPAGVSGHFFELGGHSLLATQLAAAIRHRFDVDMPLRTVFEHPVIRDLAAWIDVQAPGATLPSIEPRGREEGLLSYAQQRLWMLSRLGEASRAYNIPRALALSGPLDESALAKAFAALVARHENLRLCFPERAGEPFVRVLPPYAPLATVDIGDVHPNDLEAIVERHRHAHATIRFDLENGPLFAAKLLRLGEDEHVLLLNLQHIVGDGWSIGVFMHELAALYSAFREDRESPLPPLSIQYSDYASWQRRWLEGARMEAQLAYWKQVLADAPALLELPADHPRPAVFSYRGTHHRASFDRRLLTPLRELARRHGCTMFMTLLAAYQVFLARHADTDDVLVGIPVANREHPQTTGLIGFFVNTLVMRARIDLRSTFADLLDQTRRAALDAYQNQDVPFDRVVEAIRPARMLDRGPLFQVMFRHEAAGHAPFALPGVSLRQIVASGETAQCDLTLNLIEEGDELHGEWEFATDLFDKGTIESWHRRFERLLQAIVENMDQALPLGELALMLDDELDRVEVMGQGGRHAAAAFDSVHGGFARQAAATPDRLALIHGDEALTYRRLDELSDAWAVRLVDAGVEPGGRVAMLAPRGVHAMVGLLATLKAGAVHVPLDSRYPRARIAELLDDCAPCAVLTISTVIDDLPPIEVSTWLLDATMDGAPKLSSVRRHAEAYVIYTSGSTGRPKGVVVEHAQLLHLWRALADTVLHELPVGARIALNAELTFDASWQAILQWLSGHTLVIVPAEVRADPVALRRFIEQARIDVFDCTPAQLEPLLSVSGDIGAARVLVGGEAIAPPLWKRLAQLQGSEVYNVYGPTECTVDSTYAAVMGEHPTIGRPLPGVTVRILDTSRRPVPPGVRGEIHIGGAGVAKGYLDRAELTAQRFVVDEHGRRMYASGDLGRWLADGGIEYLGRNDHQLKLRGYRIEAGEIEARLRHCQGVKDALVMIREDAGSDRRLAAYVLAEGKQMPDVSMLRRKLLDVLPEAMVPSSFTRVRAWPLTTHGKIDRRALPVPEGRAPMTVRAEPEGDVEQRLAALWGDILQVSPIDRHDNFFDLGGHSLSAVRLQAAIRGAFGTDLALAAIFQSTSLAELAGAIAGIPPHFQA